MHSFKAILFDVDGVLVDSEPFIAEAASCMFAELYGTAVDPAEFTPFIGTGEARYLGGVAEAHGLQIDVAAAKKRTYELYFEVIRGRVQAVPGAVELVRMLREAGIKSATATSADRVKLDANLEAIGLQEEDFDSLVCGNDVNRKKPYPDIYLEAARRVGMTPEDCLVIEDATEGVLAAKAAGCLCVGLSTTFAASKLLEAGADHILPDLSGGLAALETAVDNKAKRTAAKVAKSK
ncbi:MAG: HAD-IA family hydrolase [Spirochaetia bacterium]|nr:HAD-IA family hydrolase [Spirochaetia bacterium]